MARYRIQPHLTEVDAYYWKGGRKEHRNLAFRKFMADSPGWHINGRSVIVVDRILSQDFFVVEPDEWIFKDGKGHYYCWGLHCRGLWAFEMTYKAVMEGDK